MSVHTMRHKPYRYKSPLGLTVKVRFYWAKSTCERKTLLIVTDIQCEQHSKISLTPIRCVHLHRGKWKTKVKNMEENWQTWKKSFAFAFAWCEFTLRTFIIEMKNCRNRIWYSTLRLYWPFDVEKYVVYYVNTHYIRCSIRYDAILPSLQICAMMGWGGHHGKMSEKLPQT